MRIRRIEGHLMIEYPNKDCFAGGTPCFTAYYRMETVMD